MTNQAYTKPLAGAVNNHCQGAPKSSMQVSRRANRMKSMNGLYRQYQKLKEVQSNYAQPSKQLRLQSGGQKLDGCESYGQQRCEVSTMPSTFCVGQNTTLSTKPKLVVSVPAFGLNSIRSSIQQDKVQSQQAHLSQSPKPPIKSQHNLVSQLPVAEKQAPDHKQPLHQITTPKQEQEISNTNTQQTPPKPSLIQKYIQSKQRYLADDNQLNLKMVQRGANINEGARNGISDGLGQRQCSRGTGQSLMGQLPDEEEGRIQSQSKFVILKEDGSVDLERQPQNNMRKSHNLPLSHRMIIYSENKPAIINSETKNQQFASNSERRNLPSRNGSLQTPPITPSHQGRTLQQPQSASTLHARFHSHISQSLHQSKILFQQHLVMNRIKSAAKLTVLHQRQQRASWKNRQQQKEQSWGRLVDERGRDEEGRGSGGQGRGQIGWARELEKQRKELEREEVRKKVVDQRIGELEQYLGTRSSFVYSRSQFDDFEIPASLQRVTDADQILNRLLPDKSNLILQITKMLQTEKLHQAKKRKLSMQGNQRFMFYNTQHQELRTDRQEIERQIINTLAKMAPNQQHMQQFTRLLQHEIDSQTDQQLVQILDLAHLIYKYNSSQTSHMAHPGNQQSGEQLAITDKKQSGGQQLKQLKTAREPLFDWLRDKNKQKFFQMYPKLLKFSKTERLKAISKEYVFIARMYQLKSILNQCFEPLNAKDTSAAQKAKNNQNKDVVRKYYLDDAIQRISKECKFGLFANSELMNVCAKSGIAIDTALDQLMPPQNKELPCLKDLIQKLLIKETLLKSESNQVQKSITATYQRFAPTVRSDGTLYLIEDLISKYQALNISEYIKFLNSMPRKSITAITKVVVDGIRIDSQDLIKILHCFEDVDVVVERQKDTKSVFATKLNIMTNIRQSMQRAFGSSIQHLCLANIRVSSKFIKFVTSKQLNKLYSFELVNVQSADTPNNKLLQEIEHYLVNHHVKLKLMRLKFVHLELSQQMFTVLALIESTFKSLLELELSWCNLTAQNAQDLFVHLAKLGLDDAEYHNQGKIEGTLRSLNLSYNSFLDGLNLPNKQKPVKIKKEFVFEDEEKANWGEEVTKKLRFIDSFSEYLNQGYLGKLTHLDLSGITSLAREDIQRLINDLGNQTTCGNLLSIHLNDIGINDDQALYDEIADMYYIKTTQEADNDHYGGLYLALTLYLNKARGKDYEFKKAESMQYTEVVDRALNRHQGDGGKQHNILMSMNLQLQIQMNTLKKCGLMSSEHGIRSTMHKGSNIDHFVLSRKLNLPELIFNQEFDLDKNIKKRFFDLDQASKWQLSDNFQRKDSCYVCQKHKYTIIFYERDSTQLQSSPITGRATNSDLIPINDQEFLAKLRSEYKLKYSQDAKTRKQVWTPLICGTVVRSSRRHECYSNKLEGSRINNMTFHRKLRMMRADVFTLLSISQFGEFFKDQQQSNLLQKAILKFLEGEFNERVDSYGLFSNLKGWNKLLHQKCNVSQILQVNAINQPDCVRNQFSHAQAVETGCNHYAFAAFLEPGYHQFLIYDPLTDKAFCKEMIVDFNHGQMFYPEMPKLMPQKIIKEKLPPVFRKWIRDNIERQERAYYKDTTPFRVGKKLIDNFEPEKYMKDAEDIDQCEKILLDYFDWLQLFYLHYLARSSRYPEIDLDTCKLAVIDWISHFNLNSEEDFKLSPKEVDQLFVKATKNDARADRALCRGELFDFILRVAQLKYIRSVSLRKQSVIKFQDTIIEKQKQKEVIISDNETSAIKDRVNSLHSDDSFVAESDQQSPKMKDKHSDSKNMLAGHSENSQKKSKQGEEQGQIQRKLGKNQTDVAMSLRMLIKNGIIMQQASGVILTQRNLIQNDPEVIKTFGRNLRELKLIYDFYTDKKNRRQFRWASSALRLFDMREYVIQPKKSAPTRRNSIKQAALPPPPLPPTPGEEYWKPLTSKDLWTCFVHCMMTVLDENNCKAKYWHLHITEFYEWIGRLALRSYEIQNQGRAAGTAGAESTHTIIQQFINKLFEKQAPIVGF